MPLHSHFSHLTSKKFAILIPRKCLPPHKHFFCYLTPPKKQILPLHPNIFSYAIHPSKFCEFTPLKKLAYPQFLLPLCYNIFCHTTPLKFLGQHIGPQKMFATPTPKYSALPPTAIPSTRRVWMSLAQFQYLCVTFLHLNIYVCKSAKNPSKWAQTVMYSQ